MTTNAQQLIADLADLLSLHTGDGANLDNTRWGELARRYRDPASRDAMDPDTAEIQQNAVNAAREYLQQPAPVRVFITMEGGLIQDVTADGPVEVVSADFDIDATDDERADIPQPDGTTQPAYCIQWTADEWTEQVERAYRAATELED